MREFKAILFDIDGTLLDTSEFIYQAYEHTLRKYGLPPRKRSEMATLIGKSLEMCYMMLTNLENVQKLCDEHRAFQDKHLHLSKPYPGVGKTLEALDSADLKIAVITTRSKRTALKTVELAGICKYIDCSVALEDVTNLKPHPEPIFKALEFLDVEPEDAIMVGDTDVDILAGKNAGTATVGVTYGFHGKGIAGCKPDHVIDSIDEIIYFVLPLLSTSPHP